MAWFTRFFGGKPRMPGAPPVRFDTRGWKLGKSGGTVLKWSNPDGDTLLARIDPHLRRDRLPLNDLQALRALYRDEAAKRGGGIVSVDVVRAGQLPAVKVISKYEHDLGYAYEGRLIVPLKNAFYNITMHSNERGETGSREAIATGCLAQSGGLEIEHADKPGAPGRIKGWFQDPYDPDWKGRPLYSISDDDRLDELLPQHPLSKTRNALEVIQGTLNVDPSEFPDRIDSSSPQSGETPQGARQVLPAGAVALLYLMAERFDVAEKLLAAAVLSAKEGGANDISAARHFLLLGLAQDAQGKYLDAERSLSRSWGIFRVAVGEEDPQAAQALTNLARVYLSLDRPWDAEPLFEKALKVYQEKASPGSDAAVALNGLGLVRNSQGRYAEALAYFEQALATFEKVHGPLFPDCATVTENMAAAYHGLGDSLEESYAQERARQIRLWGQKEKSELKEGLKKPE